MSADQSDADLLLQIQEYEEARGTETAILEARTASRAAARSAFLKDLKRHEDKLASMPADHPFRAKLKKRIAAKKATMVELDGTLFPDGYLERRVEVDPDMGIELDEPTASPDVMSVTSAPTMADQIDPRPREQIYADLKKRRGFRKEFAEFAHVTEDQLRKWPWKREHADDGPVDRKIRLAARAWLQKQ
jgi:hypothetical protein